MGTAMAQGRPGVQAKLAMLPPQCTLGDAADAPGAWTGARPGTPTGCAAVRLAQTFTSGQREVTALRITLRPALGGSMDVANVSVLKAG